MANAGYTSVQLHEEEDEDDDDFIFSSGAPPSTDDLQFQDFKHDEMLVKSLEDSHNKPGFGQPSSYKTAPQSEPGFINDDNSNDDESETDDKAELLQTEKKSPPFWTFEYYQTFFDVDTSQVLNRIAFSAIPNYRTNYLLTKIRPNPDLYGPFWVCATLVFTIAVGGNLASYFASEGESKWVYEFHKVTLAACAIFIYAWAMPSGLWAFLTWRGNLAGFSYLEIVCVYGYSLAVFIPISLMWSVPLDWLRWLLVLVAVTLSGSVLLLTFWRAVEDDNRQVAIITMVVIFTVHAALAIGFKLYFFRSPHTDVPNPLQTTPRSISTAAYNVTADQHYTYHS